MSGPAMDAIIRCVDAAGLVPDRGMATEGDAVLKLFANGDAAEGIAAFVEKRRSASA
jgi:enoyl-CoA hydratase